MKPLTIFVRNTQSCKDDVLNILAKCLTHPANRTPKIQILAQQGAKQLAAFTTDVSKDEWNHISAQLIARKDYLTAQACFETEQFTSNPTEFTRSAAQKKIPVGPVYSVFGKPPE